MKKIFGKTLLKCLVIFLALAVFFSAKSTFAMTPPLDAHVMTVVSKYFAAPHDYANLAKVCKEYAVVPKTLRFNPSPVESRQEAEKFQKVLPNWETYSIKSKSSGFRPTSFEGLEGFSFKTVCYEAGFYTVDTIRAVNNSPGVKHRLVEKGSGDCFKVVFVFEQFEKN